MSNIEEIIKEKKRLLSLGSNEAETRKKIIDKILFGILGWDENDSSFEEAVSEDGSTTFSDYIIRTGMTAFIIEAKRIGKAETQVPDLRKAQLNRKLVNGDIGDIITQARDYARKKSIPFAIATDGNYWIIFPATRVDQVSFSDSFAIIFKDITSALKDNYDEFYSLLSRDAVISGSLENDLLGRIDNQIEQRRLNKFFNKSFSKIHRNNLFNLIEEAINSSFTQDVVNGDPELLEKCYVKTPERVRYDKKISLHIIKRNPVVTKKPIRPLRDKDSSDVQKKILEAADSIKPVAILVLGTVGSGKTTFLEHNPI